MYIVYNSTSQNADQKEHICYVNLIFMAVTKGIPVVSTPHILSRACIWIIQISHIIV